MAGVKLCKAAKGAKNTRPGQRENGLRVLDLLTTLDFRLRTQNS
jgi:hypothetical protein